MLAENGGKKPTIALPTNVQLAQNVNCLCQCQHTNDPKDLHFDLAENFIPQGFFCKDVATICCLPLKKLLDSHKPKIIYWFIYWLPTALTTRLTNTSANCSAFHICQLNISTPSSQHFSTKQLLNHWNKSPITSIAHGWTTPIGLYHHGLCLAITVEPQILNDSMCVPVKKEMANPEAECGWMGQFLSLSWVAKYCMYQYTSCITGTYFKCFTKYFWTIIVPKWT